MKDQLIKRSQIVLLMLSGLISAPLIAATPAADDVTVSKPYVRAVPPGQPNSAAFMQLQNKGATPHAVMKAESPVAKVVELHTHINEGGVMKMRQIKKIDIPAQGETMLKPGGLHVMFLGLESELKPGQSVPVTLIYEDGSKVTIQATVRKMQMHMKQK
ncbi:MAG: copper chaperone PCu(A)C [Gammaproteobacteria bacterium]|nr:copper chaperone PCu(A)C [Gammaproteobacteria bacterium]